METVTYTRSNQWVGDLQCPRCNGLTPAWQSSGMSLCFPHFYCERCSNVIHRLSDQHLVWKQTSEELLCQIRESLPLCPCGGAFQPGANPKCSHCGYDIPHQDDPLTRLNDPHMIVVDGAIVFSDQREPYKVRIL